ncbi:hypothetical protein [Clostridium oryzae]|uniref:YhfM-like domain-containing protein n=1 Tax=Clostridium oryzae TaxID=1450648 RepID=A0A1V4IPA7_9CLOT|nr:hypothetical protein [Clostridium oryzae]OPJ61287.1 hypothetical protein CLORY_23270 [Clostridium oryzae]
MPIINIKKTIYRIPFVMLLIMTLLFSGCNRIDKLQVKLGMKNADFEYIKNNMANKIVIQSTRDLGFRFVVTDKSAIKELYSILSSAKKVDRKSSLKADYTFEIHKGDKVYKFDYIAGLDKHDAGNLFSEDGKKIYIVSRRLDIDIIKNLWNTRKPTEFEKVYYGTILKFFKDYGNVVNKKNKAIGIDISQDVEMQKYLLSIDIDSFKNKLSNVMPEAVLVDNNRTDFDVVVTLKTQGYKPSLYKAILLVDNKKEHSEKKYYVNDVYENGEWTIQISDKVMTGF